MYALRNFLVSLISFSAAAVTAGIPELESGVYVQTTNGPLTVKYYTAPSAIDWNNDGRKDLLVGQFTSGNIWLFLNQGSDARPMFGTGQQVRSGSVPITTTYG